MTGRKVACSEREFLIARMAYWMACEVDARREYRSGGGIEWRKRCLYASRRVMFYADKWVTAQGEDSLDEVHVGAEDDAFFAKGVEVVAAVFRRRPTLAK